MHRHVRVVALACAAFLPCSAGRLGAQEFVRQKLLVVTFESGGSNLGRRVADAVESAIDHGKGRDLTLADRGDMLRELEKSGFNADSVLLPTEIRSLARRYRADEYVMGRATPGAGRAVRVEGWLVMSRDSTLRQPIAVEEQPSAAQAAEAFGAEVLRAREQLTPVRRCENALRAGHAADAATAALAGIRAYPRAAIARTCLLRAYQALGYPADSLLRVSGALLAVDSTSIRAWEAAAASYDAQGRRDSAGKAWAMAAQYERHDAEAIARIVSSLMAGGNAAIAKPIIATAVGDHPEDAHLAGLHWRVLLATEDWAEAARVGEALRKEYPDYETQPEYFLRMATSYRNLGDPLRAVAVAAEGVARHGTDPDLYLLYTQLVLAESDSALARGLARFPKNGRLLAYDAQLRRRRGDLQGALESTRRAIAQDSTLARGSLQLAQAYFDVGRPDSALVVVEAGLRTASDSALAAQFTLARGNTLYRAANTSRKREDFELALRYLRLSDRLAPSANAGFLVGSAAFGIAQLASAEATPARSCALATEADEHLVVAEVQLARNGAVAPDAAKQFLDYAGQLHPFVAQQVKSFCPVSAPAAAGRSGAPAGSPR